MPQRRVCAASLAIVTFMAAQWPAGARAAAPQTAAPPETAAPSAPSTSPVPTQTPATPSPVVEGPTDANGWPVTSGATPTTAAGADEITLQDGGFVRGTIVELEPGKRVVILVDGTAERREITWDKVAEVQRAKHAGGTAAPRGPEVESPMVPSRGRPRIHLELARDKPVTLYEVDAEIVASGYNASMYGMKFRSVCVAPCDRIIDGSRGQQFFLATGESAMWTASRKLTLAQRSGDVPIYVKPGNRGMRLAGAILFGIGLGCVIGGPLLFLTKSTRPAGIAFLAVGGPTLLAGLPMMILGRTRYEIGARDSSNDP